MSLAKAEVRRLFKRRVTLVVLVLVLLGLAAFPIGFMLASKTSTPQERARAEASAQADFEFAQREHNRMLSECEAAKARGEDITRNFPPDCGAEWAPTQEMFSADGYMPYEFSFRDEFPISLFVFSAIVAMAMFLLGASFVGAEWRSGGMMNLLLWRPRRLGVLATKLLVLLAGTLGATLALGALWTAGFWAIGRFDGTLGRMTSGVWQSFALTGLRGVTLVLAAAALGFGLASLGRHTATALGAAAGVFVVSEIGLRIALEVIQLPFRERFYLSTWVGAWFEKKTTIYNYRECEFAQGVCNPGEMVLTWPQAGVIFGIAVVLVTGLAFYTMRRRDIT